MYTCVAGDILLKECCHFKISEVTVDRTKMLI